MDHRERHIVIRGRRYRLVFTRLPADADGICDAPDMEGKRIRIRKSLRGQRLLDTLIHEMLHAAFWDMDEEAVHDAAHDIAAVLWRLGYRLPLKS